MAKCRQCGANVGCGCQLINGLCAYCHGIATKGKQSLKNVISKIGRH
jgi:hypothetical protein